MRVALINTPSLSTRPVSRSMAGGLGFDGHETVLLPPLDLAMMAETLRRTGYEVVLLDADPLRLDTKGVLDWLERRPCDLCVATVSLPTIDHDVRFLVALRQRFTTMRIWAKTLIRDQAVLRTVLERSGVEAVIHGEAELSIPQILAGQSRAGTAWLETREGTAEALFRFDLGEPIADLDTLPLPARDLLPNERYCYHLLGGPAATLQTSRGCPYPCRYYCPYPLVEGTKWRAQSPQRILDELRQVVTHYGIRKIYFRDATFTLNPNRIEQLCEGIRQEGWNLEWVCETRVDCLPDSLLEAMQAAGCRWILAGVETGDETVMASKEGKRGLTLNKLEHLRDRCRRLGIRLNYLLMVGLPKETKESIVDTYELITRHKPDSIGVTIITPYPGTPLYEEGLKAGWIDSQDWKEYGGHQVSMHTPSLSRDDLFTARQFLEEGFALVKAAESERHDRRAERQARQHYYSLLRWAYELNEPLRELRTAMRSLTQCDSPSAVSDSAAKERNHRRLSSERHECLALSVVIPTYNRAEILQRTLQGYAAQTWPVTRFEIILVDDGSDDRTELVATGRVWPFRVRFIRQDHEGANAARNRGIAAASGDIVLLTGDDMVPPPDFLHGHAEFHHRHPDYQDALLGGIEWFPEIEITPLMRYVVSPEGGQQFSLHLARDGRADFSTFYTCNVSVKRRLLTTQNPIFDPAFRYPAYDDVELGYRLQKAGMRLHYRPQVVAYHNHPLTIDDFARKMRQAGCMAVVLARKHPELETSFLRLNALLSRLDRYSEDLAASLRLTLAELEKVHVAALATLRLNGRSFDAVYAEQVLYPVYGAFFTTMYALGVADAVQAVPQRSEVRHKKSLPACSIDSATLPSHGGIKPAEDRSRSQPSESNPQVPIPPQNAIVSGPSPAFRGQRLPQNGQPFGINFIGYLSGNLGLGVFARHVLRLLLDRNIPVAAVDLDPGCGRAQADRTYSHLFAKSLDECRYPLTLFALNGDSLARVPSHVLEALAARSLLTALPFWELPVLPPAWLGPLQRLDALVAPSDFVRSALENALSGIPIIRAHVPIRLPEPIAPDRRKFGLPDTAFVLLTCFEPHSDPVRKNPQGAIEAFRSAWPDDPSVRLVVKVNNAVVGERTHPVMEHLRKEADRDPRLILLDRPLPYREVLELLASIDVFVSLHRAEGFGLPMFEAMALGKPVVATAWSGNMSFMTYDAACLVGYQWRPVHGSLPVYRPEYLGRDCHWAEPSISEAVAWLDRLRRDPELCAAIGERAKARVNDYNAAAQRGQWIEELAAIVAARQRGIGGNTAWNLSPATASDATFQCSIIIPVCNKAELTANCLTALAHHTQRTTYEVILVDNGSTDETPSLLTSLGRDVQVIRNAENLGFAKACNQGAKVARGRYLVFLNNDTIPQPDWLDALVREVEEYPDVAVVGSKLLYPDETVQHAGVAFSRKDRIPYHLYQGFPANAPAVNRRRELQCVTAACMLIRREVFLTVGGFDEGYRNGFEDIDLCLKVRERGHRVVYQPHSVVIHLEEQTPGRKVHDQENIGRFLERWGTRWRLADEDLLAFEDGFRCDHPSPHLVRWCALASDAEREAWRFVADVQRAAQRQDDETVRRLLRQPEQWPADPEVLRWGAAVAKALEEMAAAGSFWQRLLLFCEDVDARLGLARQAIVEGRLEEAQHHLDHLPSHAVNGGEVYLVRGVLAMQRQAFRDAAEAFEAARSHGANQRRALMGLGMAALGAGQIERSWDAFLAVLKQEPDDAEAVHWLLRAGTALGRWKDLAEVLARFVDRNPGDLSTRFALAGVLLRDGRVAEARREEQVLQLLNPQYEGLDELTRALDGHPLCAPSSVLG